MDIYHEESDKPPPIHKTGFLCRLAQLGISVGIGCGVLTRCREMDSWRDLPCPDVRIRARNY